MKNEEKKWIKHDLYTIEDIIDEILDYNDTMAYFENLMRDKDKILTECPTIVMEKDVIKACNRMKKVISNIKDFMEEISE